MSTSKIKIHNIEDNAEHSKWVKISFCPSKYMVEKQRLAFFEEHFTFKRFTSVGEAIKYYESTKDYPDVVIIDIDFTGLSAYPKKYHLDEATPNKGAEAVLFALEHFPNKIIIPFTGQYDAFETYKGIEKFEKFLRTVPKSKDKSRIRNLERKNPENLKEVAIKYFKRMGSDQREKLVALIADSNYKNETILNMKVLIGQSFFQIRHLLVGWWDEDSETILEPKKIIQKLLDETFEDFKLLGNWKEKYYPYWLEYLKSDDIGLREQLHYQAFNFLLESIFIRNFLTEPFDLMDGKTKICSDMEVRVTSTLPNWNILVSEEDWRKFYDKLVGRRVMLGWSEYFEYGEPFGFIIDLLVHGRNIPYSSKSTSVLNHNLGLKKISRQWKFDKSDGLLFLEERVWLDHFIPLLRPFLDFIIEVEDSIAFEFRKKYFIPEIRNLHLIREAVKNNCYNLTPADYKIFCDKVYATFTKMIPLNNYTKVLSIFK